MVNIDRRKFLIGLFGTAAVVAAGALPKALEQLPEQEFKAIATHIKQRADEIYGDDKGHYAFARFEYTKDPPYMRVFLPEGFRPLREESDRIGQEAIERLINEAKS